MSAFSLQNETMQVRNKFGCGVRIQDIVVSASSCGLENHNKISKKGWSCGRVGPSGVFHNTGNVVGRVGDVEVLCLPGGNSGQIALDVNRETMEQLFHGNFADGRCCRVVGRLEERVETPDVVVVERGEDEVTVRVVPLV